MSLLDCNVPAGFEIHFDLSSLSKASRTKIRKWLTQGYTQISTGSNRSIYEYFARLADLPIAGVGQ